MGKKDRIKKARYYKARIKLVISRLENDYKKGLISYDEYWFKISKFLKGRTKKEWYKHYEDYIKNKQLRLDKPREHRFSNISLLVLFIVIISSGLYFGNLTGLITFNTEPSTDNLNLVFSNDTNYSLLLQGNPGSLRLSGSVTGDGSFSVYLLYNNSRYLIVDSDVLSSQPSLITGAVVANEFSVNETTTTKTTTIEPTTSIETTTTETTTTSVEFAINETTTIEETTTSTDFVVNETTTIIEETAETTTSVKKTINAIESFSEKCIETCSLSDIGNNIVLEINIDNTALTLSSISYNTEVVDSLDITAVAIKGVSVKHNAFRNILYINFPKDLELASRCTYIGLTKDKLRKIKEINSQNAIVVANGIYYGCIASVDPTTDQTKLDRNATLTISL